jgi:hypothetical protein
MQDDNQNNQNINKNQSAVPQPTNQSINPPQISENKEQEPAAAPAKTESEHQFESANVEIALSHQPEVPIPPELENTIKQSPDTDTVRIDKEVSSAGVAPAKESTPVIATPTGDITLPMNYATAKEKQKQTKISDSMHWLSSIIIYQWLKYDPNTVSKG